jgi:hypothetical protein
MRILTTGLLTATAISLAACGQSSKKDGKKADKEIAVEQKNITVSEEEMAARAKVYDQVAKTVVIRVKLDKNGKEIPETAELRYLDAAKIADDGKEAEALFAESKEPENYADENTDNLDGVSDSSTNSFHRARHRAPGAPILPGRRAAYYEGMIIGMLGYIPRANVGGQSFHYGPRRVCATPAYNYHTYQAQGSQYYANQGYAANYNSTFYQQQSSYFSSNGMYTSPYVSSYNSWDGNYGGVGVNPAGPVGGPGMGNPVGPAGGPGAGPVGPYGQQGQGW